MRTLVDLPKPDIDALDELRRRRRVSRAKVIREAVSDYVQRNAASVNESAFGLWEHGTDGVDYQRSLRSEW